MSETVIIQDGHRLFYDDLQVAISSVKIPTANAPGYEDYAFGIASGITFPVLAFALNEYIYFDIQTSHSMKLETPINFHIHFVLPNTTNVGDKFKFQLDVVAAGLHRTFAVPTGSPFSGEHTIAADDNIKGRVLGVALIPGVNDTVSTIYKCKLTRVAATANEYGSDVYVNFMDSHYQKDQPGSRSEYIK